MIKGRQIIREWKRRGGGSKQTNSYFNLQSFLDLIPCRALIGMESDGQNLNQDCMQCNIVFFMCVKNNLSLEQTIPYTSYRFVYSYVVILGAVDMFVRCWHLW